MPAAKAPAPLMMLRRDGAMCGLNLLIVLPWLRQYFLISAVNYLRLSFCEYWSNGLAAATQVFTISKGDGQPLTA